MQKEFFLNWQFIRFLLGFIIFLVGMGFLIATTMKKLNGNVDRLLHGILEIVLIAGILLGVIAMFQPWSLALYGIGFHVLLACVIGFTIWSHIMPRLRKS